MRGGIGRIKQTPMVFPDFGDGKCLRCGKELVGRQRKYCSGHCGWYYRRFTAEYVLITWGDFKERMLKRDNHKCLGCGEVAEEVHHIQPLYRGGREFDADNCISLCHKCHMRRHRQLRAEDNAKDIIEDEMREFEESPGSGPYSMYDANPRTRVLCLFIK